MKRLNLFLGAVALFAVSMAVSPSVTAQENRDENGKILRGPYETNRFIDNWFIGAGGGINVFWNEGLAFENLKIAPSIDANIGKWFTPAIGMRIGYQGLNTQIRSDGHMSFGDVHDSETGKYDQKLGYMYIHGDFLWNMSDAIGGYKEKRFWDFVPYLHAGFFRSYGVDDNEFAENELAVGAGLLHNLRLTEWADFIIDMKLITVNGRVYDMDGVSLVPSVTMGFAFDLGFPSFIRTYDVINGYNAIAESQIAALETSAMALEMANIALQEENQELTSEKKKMAKEMKTLRQRESYLYTADEFFDGMSSAVFYFDIGKTTLSAKELNHLDFIASNIISRIDETVTIYITIIGTADGATGSYERNEYLSRERAQYVYDLLTSDYGISPERIELCAEVVEDCYDPEMDRSVVIDF